MSQFSFPCPACHQTVSCDTTQAGKEMTCPLCQASIVVREPAPAGVAAPPPITPVGVATPAGNPSPFAGYTGTTAQKTSGLAIASLVCSLSSLITCVGWLPGIICGHLAKSRIRRNSSLTGRGLATAGLLIGYLVLLFELVTGAYYVWRISAAVKQGIAEARQNLATNQVVIPETESATDANNSEPAEPAAPAPVVTTASPPVKAVAVDWSADLRAVPVPDHPVSGKLRGQDFTLKTALFRNGDLKLTAPNGMAVDIYRLGASIEGQNFEVQAADNNNANPRVKMAWNEGDAEMTATFSKHYAMKLQFEQAQNHKVAGKIYLCFPDEARSCVAGTFEVRLLRPRNGAGK